MKISSADIKLNNYLIEHKTFLVEEIYVFTRAHTLTVSLYFEHHLFLDFFFFFSDLFV